MSSSASSVLLSSAYKKEKKTLITCAEERERENRVRVSVLSGIIAEIGKREKGE